MPDFAYAAFIEDCRQERAHLIGLIEALEGRRMSPGLRITVPDHLAAATAATRTALETALTQLNALLDAYNTNPGA